MAKVSWWNFHFRIFPGAIRNPRVVGFLRHLERYLSGKLLNVRDCYRAIRADWFRTMCRHSTDLCGWNSYLPRIGPKPARVLAVAFKATQVTEPLPERLPGVEPLRPRSAVSDGPAAYGGDGLSGSSRDLWVLTMSSGNQ